MIEFGPKDLPATFLLKVRDALELLAERVSILESTAVANQKETLENMRLMKEELKTIGDHVRQVGRPSLPMEVLSAAVAAADELPACNGFQFDAKAYEQQPDVENQLADDEEEDDQDPTNFEPSEYESYQHPRHESANNVLDEPKGHENESEVDELDNDEDETIDDPMEKSNGRPSSSMICAQILKSNQYNRNFVPDDGGDFSDSNESIGDPLRTPEPERQRVQSISGDENWRSAESSFEDLATEVELTPQSKKTVEEPQIVPPITRRPSPPPPRREKQPSPRVETKKPANQPVSADTDWPDLSSNGPNFSANYVSEGPSMFGNWEEAKAKPKLPPAVAPPASRVNGSPKTQVGEVRSAETAADAEKLWLMDDRCHLWLFVAKSDVRDKGLGTLRLVENLQTNRLRCTIHDDQSGVRLVDFLIERQFKLVRSKKSNRIVTWSCTDLANPSSSNTEKGTFICHFETPKRLEAFEKTVGRYVN